MLVRLVNAGRWLSKRWKQRTLGKLLTYDPTTHGVYDLKKEIVVPAGQAIYDPKVFGRYDLASQRLVSKEEVTPEVFNLDVLMLEAQRYIRTAPFKLETDRYTQVLGVLAPGSGICLDACTNQPLDSTRERVSALGYEYVPIDLHGDGKSVTVEDLTRLSFPSRSVASIISLDTLEHIDDYAAAIAELYRVLAEDGLAIFHIPCYYFDKAMSEPIEPGVDPWGHVRYFSAREIIGRLASVGFVILRVALQLDYGAVMCIATKRQDLMASR